MLQLLRRLIGCSCEKQADKPSPELAKESFAAEIDRATERIKLERERQEQIVADLVGDPGKIAKIDPIVAAVVRRLRATGGHLVLSEQFPSLSRNGVSSHFSRIVLTGDGLRTVWIYENPPTQNYLGRVTADHLASARLTVAAVIDKIHAHAQRMERDPLPEVPASAPASAEESPYISHRRSAND